MHNQSTGKLIAALLLCAVVSFIPAGNPQAGTGEKIKLTITDGHGTDPRDHGRPVVLIANALGVKPEVFREAFSHVNPAPGGTEPEPAQVQRNKSALLAALGKYGVTNERLDQVSNYYRYRPESGRLWPISTAAAYVTLAGGKVSSIEVSDGGAGYSTAPTISVPGHPEISLKATLAFGKDLKKNGVISGIALKSDDRASR